MEFNSSIEKAAKGLRKTGRKANRTGRKLSQRVGSEARVRFEQEKAYRLSLFGVVNTLAAGRDWKRQSLITISNVGANTAEDFAAPRLDRLARKVRQARKPQHSGVVAAARKGWASAAPTVRSASRNAQRVTARRVSSSARKAS